MSKVAGLILGSAALVAGHGYVSGAVVDGTYYGGYLVTEYPYESSPPEVIAWSETETDLGYIDGSEYANSNIICHKEAKPGALEAPVKAGGSVELQWTEWPSSHHGPVITYMANCNGDCADVDKTTLEFFKIDQGGLISDTTEPGTWATDNLIANNNSRTVTIPSDIADGNYVLRHEIIALHSAEEKNGAQNYPQCINLKVSGGGSATPSGTLGTALYKDTDPGILINIYQSLSTYDIPGPTLYTAGAAAATTGASATSSSPATTAAAATSTASASAEATTSAPAVSSVVPSSSPVSSTPIRSSSPLPAQSNTASRGWRPSFTRSPGAPRFTTAPAGPHFTVPGGSEHHQSSSTPVAPVVVTKTLTSTSWVTDVVTLTDSSVVQTTSAVPVEVTVTTTLAGSAPTQASSSGSDSSSASGSDSSSSSGSSSSSSGSTSGSSSSSTTSSSGSTTTSAASDYNSSDWLSYLNSLSAEEVLKLLRQTFKWLTTDKVHARDLSN